MASNRIVFVRGTTRTFEISLVDIDGNLIKRHKLNGATADFYLRINASDITDVLHFDLTDPTHLTLRHHVSLLSMNLFPDDTSGLDIGEYTYRLRIVYSDGEVFYPIDWSPFDLGLGGSTAPVPPVFDNTIKVDQNYGTMGALQYLTSGGSPIDAAQIRVYYKSDVDAGNLDNPVGVSVTNPSGNWALPVLVRPGFTYTIIFAKPNEFGPDKVEIVA